MLRSIGFLVGLALLLIGAVGSARVFAADRAVGKIAGEALAAATSRVGNLGFQIDVEAVVGHAVVAPVLSLLGFVFLTAALAAGRRRTAGQAAGRASASLAAPDRKIARKILRQATAVARRGHLLEAAEICSHNDLLDEAAGYFEAAGEPIRAAEIRHDQNRFLESAELYLQAGNFEAAGTILASQEEYGRAAECYERAGRKSVAAEMFETAGDFQRAAQCFDEAEFHRQAATCYEEARMWADAARCLERVLIDEAQSADPNWKQERRNLVLRAAELHQQADDPASAMEALERGDCFAEAAELARSQLDHQRAAQLFLQAHDAPRAAEAFHAFGEDQAAARVLGEYYRDRGEDEQAAIHLEKAGEHLDAGDLYRKIEQYERAGDCYEQHGDGAQAAEMFRLLGQLGRAAENFERASRFREAADCWAEAGDLLRQAELLVRAGNPLAAGEIYHREGMDDEAIKILQQVSADVDEFPAASAILGSIFRARGLHSLAVKKLEQALGSDDPGPRNLEVCYQLATVHEAAENLPKAVDLYEKILTVDYHYADVGERLAAARPRLDDLPARREGDSRGGQSLGHPSRSGRYEIVGELGRGGMGIVYKARDTVLDRVVAYKVLPDALKESPRALKNFLREAKSAAQLNHPNIVTVYDAGEENGRYYIAMEYVDGTTLKEILRRRKVVAPNGVVHVLLQMSAALAYAHDKKIVHRDVKTANTMWTRDRTAKIMDFGLAKVVEEVRNHTTLVSGTPYYMSPEQTLGRNVDQRTDIYSLGVTLFELATGVLPFQEGNVPYHHVHTPAPDPREVNPNLPPLLARIISRCMQKDPAARYQSAHEISAEIRAAIVAKASSSQGSTAPSVPPRGS